MRALVQRAARGAVTIGGERVGSIGRGLVVLLGVTHSDDSRDVDFLVDKCVNLRIFEDDAGKMNRSLVDVGGGMLVISQFTLYGDASHGRRPGFTEAALPDLAVPLYEDFIAKCRGRVAEVATGRFGADMQVELVNDGPVTLMLESRK